jgi:hypothetical protein
MPELKCEEFQRQAFEIVLTCAGKDKLALMRGER